VRLLLDANLSPEVVRQLNEAGHEAIHVGEIGLLTAPDPEIMRAAADADRILVTADSDFAAMLALGGARAPSVVLLRSADHMRAPEQAALLAANLPGVAEELERGAIVSLTRRHLRVRELPIARGS
jgi:predicted nuclease of predicted toxin-antitoxin system